VGVVVSHFGDNESANYTASIPDPIFFNKPKTVTGTVSDLKRTEWATSPHVLWVFPLTDKMDISAALGIAIIELAAERGLGISTFVSVGNKADVSGNDLLEYWEGDPATRVLLLYLESFGNPRRFARLARRISRKKPIVAVKSGRTRAGARAAGSHTAALGLFGAIGRAHSE